jgi:hypothetical protein
VACGARAHAGRGCSIIPEPGGDTARPASAPAQSSPFKKAIAAVRARAHGTERCLRGASRQQPPASVGDRRSRFASDPRRGRYGRPRNTRSPSRLVIIDNRSFSMARIIRSALRCSEVGGAPTHRVES